MIVIGIWIALQLNNWNEERKLSRKANVYRERLASDLASDLRNIDALLKQGEQMQEGIETYFEYFDNQDSTLDTILSRATTVPTAYFRYFPINYTFQDMKES